MQFYQKIFEHTTDMCVCVCVCVCVCDVIFPIKIENLITMMNNWKYHKVCTGPVCACHALQSQNNLVLLQLYITQFYVSNRGLILLYC